MRGLVEKLGGSALILAAIAVLAVIGKLAWDVDESVRRTQPQVASTLYALNIAVIHADATIEKLRDAADTQTAYWNKSAAESAKTVRAVRQLIDRTDRSLNDKLIPNLDADANSVGTASQADLAQLSTTITSLNRVVQDLDTQVNDPAIRASLDNTAASTAELRATMGDVHRATGDLAEAVHRETRPASWTVKTVGFAIDKLSALSGLILGLVK